LTSFDHIITNGDCESLPEGIQSEKMMLVAGMLRSLRDGQGWRLAQFKGCSVHAVAGIGNPERFFRLLEQSGIRVIEHAFPDHHAFTEQDFEQMKPDFPVLMTEKDAVKCSGMDLKNAWFLSVEAVLPAAWEARLVRQVLERLKSPALSS
jgi:tetraacyldisaccharide 4'-kinase